MSKITEEQLLAGVIFGDAENQEYLYLPGGEVGSDHPFCILERKDSRQDLPLAEAVPLVQRLALHPCSHPVLGKKAY